MLYRSVQLHDEEESLCWSACSCRIRPWQWHVGQLHMTTHRLVWLPSAYMEFSFGLPPSLTIDRRAIVRVTEDNSTRLPIWMPLKWMVATTSDRHVFSFGIFSNQKRKRWLKAIAQWSNQ